MRDPTTRRNFLLGAVAGTAALATGWSEDGLAIVSARTDLVAARKQAACRPRRVIFNNDGDDIWAKGADTIEKFLAIRHDPLLETQVDSIYYCTTQSFNLFTHETNVAEKFLSREASFANNNLAMFLEHQTDGLRISCEFARRHKLESIWTLRMNDIHDAWTPQFVSQWKKDDPRRVMSTLEATKSFNDRQRLWSLVDADKLYSISDAGNYTPAHYWSKDAEQFEKALPVELKAGEATSLPELIVGANFGPASDVATAELRVDVTGLAADAPLKATLNGTTLNEPKNAEAVAQIRRFRFAVPVSSIRAGANQLALAVPNGGVHAVGVELCLIQKARRNS